MNDRDRQELMDELLAHHYGCANDPERIETLLAGDAEVRALRAEVLETAGLVESAARETGSRLDFADLARAHEERERGGNGRRWVAAAAAILVLIAAVPLARWGLARHDRRQAEARELLIALAGPAETSHPDLARFRVETFGVNGLPRETRVRWEAVDVFGRIVSEGSRSSDGACDLDLVENAERVAFLRVSAEDPETGATESAQISVGRRAGSPLVQLTLSKPVYRPGETMRVRGVILDRIALTETEGSLHLRVADARGQAVSDLGLLASSQGVVAGEWAIPAQQAGGDYRVELLSADGSLVVEHLDFRVMTYSPPRIDKDIDLDRESYARGEVGHATVELERIASASSALPMNVEAQVVLDGEIVWSEPRQVRERTKERFEFRIPETVKEGRGRFTVIVRDGTLVETGVETFFVPGEELRVTFFPEGGEFIAGRENRVYVQVRDVFDRPASARGRVLDDRGRETARFETEHQGRGRVSFFPEEGVRYSLRLDGETAAHDLPLPESQGVVLHATRDSTPAGEPVLLDLDVEEEGPWVVTLACRGEIVAQDLVSGRGRHALSLAAAPGIAGVLRATVYDRAMTPVAERLVHRASARRISVEVEPEKAGLAPGETQTLRFVARDETGAPVVAVLGVGVADAAARAYDGEARIGLADRQWLFADVEDLEDVEEFLVDDPNAARNIDLLLGTEGWRRLAWVDPAAFQTAEGDRAKRELARLGTVVPPRLGEGDSSGLPRVRRAETAERAAFRAARPLGLLLLTLGGGAAVFFALRRRAERAARPATRRALGYATMAALLAIWPLSLLVDLAAPRPEGIAPSFEASRLVASLDARVTTTTMDTGLSDLTVLYGYEVFTRGVTRDRWNVVYPPAGAVPMDAMIIDQLGAPIQLGRIAEARAGLELKLLEKNVDLFEVERVFRLRQMVDAKNERAFVGLVLPNVDDVAFPGGFAPGGGGGPGPGGATGWLGHRKGISAEQAAGLVLARVYAYRRLPGADAATRADFADCLYWNPLLKTDENGVAEASFQVSDRVTQWEVFCDAHGGGRIGQAEATFATRLPLAIDVRLPDHALEGDRFDLPMRLEVAPEVRGTARVRIEAAKGLELLTPAEIEVPLEGHDAVVLASLRVTAGADEVAFAIEAETEGWKDRVAHAMPVGGRGFPRRLDHSGALEKSDRFSIGYPNEVLEGSASSTLRFFPDAPSLLEEGLSGMLQEPGGCFEQTSSRNYPNALVLSYLRTVEATDHALETKARGLLERGYGKLVAYECSDRGYEWWGANPAHESLSAYGLLEFDDMKSVFPVDETMIARTRDWLLARRDGKGGFTINGKALDQFGRAPAEVTRAYCLYALAATGTPEKEIAKELDALRDAELGEDGGDGYRIALAALALQAAGRTEEAGRARARLVALQAEDGSLDGAATITMSGERDRKVEATSFAALAWLAGGENRTESERAIRFLVGQRRGPGTFGATQATVMALKALTTHAAANRAPRGSGVITVRVNGVAVAELPYGPETKGAIELADFHRFLVPGPNDVEIESTGGEVFPWTFDLDYRSEQPGDDPDCALSLDARFRRTELRRGDLATIDVTVENLEEEGRPMAIARIGLPGGVSLVPTVMDALVAERAVDFWEMHGSELVLYWRDLEPREVVKVAIEVEAAIPGVSRGLASRAHLYYTPDSTVYLQPLEVTISE